MMSSTSSHVSSDKDSELLPLLTKEQDEDEQGGAKSKDDVGGKVHLDNYDQLLDYFGDMGVWQFSTIAILWPPSIAGGIIVLLSSFTALEPRALRCALECDGPLARFNDVNTSSFYQVENPTSPMDFCTKPNVTFNPLLISIESNNCSLYALEREEGNYEECQSTDRIIYEPFEFDRTIATDFHLVCDQQYKVALSGTLYFVGLLIGALIAGYPADKIGRKPVLFFFIFTGGMSTLVGGLVSSFGAYSFFRLLAGIGEQGLTQITCTMSIEIVGAKYQSLVGNWNQIFFALGTGVTGLCAYLIRDWRYLHFATAGLIIPQLLLWWLIPESPRWLINQRKWEEANKVIDKMQKWNKVILPPRFIIPHQEKHHYSSQKKVPKESELKWYDCLTHETLRKRTWIMMVNWGIVALVYYGIGMSTTQLGGDIFLNFILAAVGEILGYCYNIAVMDFWGRKPTMVLGFLIAGVCCVSAGVIPEDLGPEIETLRLVLLILGKMGCSGAFAVCYVYTSELFPTPIRTTAVGFCSMSSRLVSILAPYLTLYLPDVTFKQLPFIVFGLGTLLGAIVSAFLPESLGHPLPDTLEDAAKLGTSKSMWSCWSRSKLAEEVRFHQEERMLKK